MKRFLVSLALGAVLALPFGMHAASAATSTMMPTCAAGDPVVWVNTKSHVFHPEGDAYFGKTKSGKYACKSAAVAMGAHPSGAMSAKKSTMKHSMGHGMKATCDTGGMGMASPMPSKHHHKKHRAMMPTSPSPLGPTPSPTPTN